MTQSAAVVPIPAAIKYRLKADIESHDFREKARKRQETQRLIMATDRRKLCRDKSLPTVERGAIN